MQHLCGIPFGQGCPLPTRFCRFISLLFTNDKRQMDVVSDDLALCCMECLVAFSVDTFWVNQRVLERTFIFAVGFQTPPPLPCASTAHKMMVPREDRAETTPLSFVVIYDSDHAPPAIFAVFAVLCAKIVERETKQAVLWISLYLHHVSRCPAVTNTIDLASQSNNHSPCRATTLRVLRESVLVPLCASGCRPHADSAAQMP